MTNKLKEFSEKVSADEALKAEFEVALTNVKPEDQIPVVIAFAKRKGYELSKEDFVDDGQDLSLDELGNVTGGGFCPCALYGIGDGDGLFCKCPFGGVGYVDNAHNINSQGGCVCVATGAGATNRH